MSQPGSEFRNLVLISQVAICVMVPLFVCVALGVWIDNKLGTWFSVPLLVLGIAAGGRNAYVLLKSVIDTEEYKRKKKLEEEIQEKVKRANKEE